MISLRYLNQIHVRYSDVVNKLWAQIENQQIICYEDMKENPVKEVERIATFLNLSLQPDELEKVAQVKK